MFLNVISVGLNIELSPQPKKKILLRYYKKALLRLENKLSKCVIKGCQKQRYKNHFCCKDHWNQWGCPYRDTEIIIGTSITYYCRVIGKELCISQEICFDHYKECSYYLFPEPLCKNYNKKGCIVCPCDKFEKKGV